MATERTVGNAIQSGQLVTLDLDELGGFYLRRSACPIGIGGNTRFPDFFTSIFARLFYSTWALNLCVPSIKYGPVELHAASGAYFVEWHVRAGQEVFFSHRNLVGFQKGMTLHTRWNFTLPCVALGHPILNSISGPGLLILETSGLPTLATGPSDIGGFRYGALVAWARGSEFRFEKFNTWFDLYFGPVTLDCLQTSGMVIDAVDHRSGAVREAHLW